MKPYAEVIGDPISHSKSPKIHGLWLNALGLDATYHAHHVRPEHLFDYVQERRDDPLWRGCNVTIPHKEQVATYADLVDAKVVTIGASNCLYRNAERQLVATNTDVDGIDEAIGHTRLDGRIACVLGNGGAARAAFHALQHHECQVHVLARNPDKAVQVARSAGCIAQGFAIDSSHQALNNAALFINATQLGMTGQTPMPSIVLNQIDALSPDALVFDMVYAPLETALLATARGKNRHAVDGLTMLIGQAATAFRHFFGVAAPRNHDATLRSLLTA